MIKKTPKQRVGSVVLSGFALGLFGTAVLFAAGFYLVDNLNRRI